MTRKDALLALAATLWAALAFNLVFFVQELALVVPKALVPGIHVTLYHNNHHWTGNDPILALLQGTGALADLTMGVIFAGLLRAGARSLNMRLFLFWMAFEGLYQGLSQILLGTFLPGNDAGMAMGWLGFGAGAKVAAAILAVIAMAAAGVWLMRKAIKRLATDGEAARPAARMGFIFRAVTLPALLAVIVLIPFREPRNIIEVAVLPLIVMVSGLIWIQGSAAFGPETGSGARPAPSLLMPLLALLVVLAFFQIVLRPGIAFS